MTPTNCSSNKYMTMMSHTDIWDLDDLQSVDVDDNWGDNSEKTTEAPHKLEIDYFDQLFYMDNAPHSLDELVDSVLFDVRINTEDDYTRVRRAKARDRAVEKLYFQHGSSISKSNSTEDVYMEEPCSCDSLDDCDQVLWDHTGFGDLSLNGSKLMCPHKVGRSSDLSKSHDCLLSNETSSAGSDSISSDEQSNAVYVSTVSNSPTVERLVLQEVCQNTCMSAGTVSGSTFKPTNSTSAYGSALNNFYNHHSATVSSYATQKNKKESSRDVDPSMKAKREKHNAMEKVRRRVVAEGFEALSSVLAHKGVRKPSKATVLIKAHEVVKAMASQVQANAHSFGLLNDLRQNLLSKVGLLDLKLAI